MQPYVQVSERSVGTQNPTGEIPAVRSLKDLIVL